MQYFIGLGKWWTKINLNLNFEFVRIDLTTMEMTLGGQIGRSMKMIVMLG
jgi:hypothetical protein